MIKLYQFKPAWGLPNPSPFCMKVETYLRMAGLSYEVIHGAVPFKAPKKKLPYIEDGTQVVADSGFIFKYLKQTYGDELDENLSAIGSPFIPGGSRSQFTWKRKGVFFGTIDAIVYSFLANILMPPLKSPLKDHGMSLPNF